MKTSIFLTAILTFMVFNGCVYTPPPRALPPEMTIDDVLTLSQTDVPDATIIGQIDASRTVFHLRTEDILRLKTANVSFVIIDHMLLTEKRAIAARERARYRSYCDHSYNYHYGYYYRRSCW